MRDMLVLALLVLTCIWTLRQAWVGVIAWSAVSLGSPHVAIGYAAGSWPVASAIGACTLIALIYARERQNPFVGAPAWFTLALTLWMCVTLPFSLAFDDSLPLWERSMKIFFMLFVSMALLTDRRKLHVFIWANVAAVGFYGVKGGVFALLTGGSFRIWGPGGFIGENNSLALALIMVLPLMRYLQLQASSRRVRLGLGVAMGLTVMAVLSSQSRGAFLGVAAMGLFFWLKGAHKLRWGVMLVVVAVLGLSFMPAEWWERMNTIRSYEVDESALGRLNAWQAAWNIATHRIVGGGCVVAKAWIYQIYAPNPNLVHVAHSIYFQMLGEQGFIGLFLFLGVFVSSWTTAGRMARAARLSGDPSQRWAAELGSLIQVSLIGYAVTGAFLNLAYFDLPYNLMAMAVLAARFAAAERSLARDTHPVQAQQPGVPARQPEAARASLSGPSA